MIEQHGVGLCWMDFVEILVGEGLEPGYVDECMEKLLADDIRFLKDPGHWFVKGSPGACFVAALKRQEWFAFSVLWGDARDLFEDEYQQRGLRARMAN